MYNYCIVSAEVTLIVISASTSECKETFTLNFPSDLISSIGCIIEGLISILFSSWINFAKLIQEENKIDIKPSMIQPIEEIKSLGKFKVKVSLHSEVDAEITIKVTSADTIQ